jgi:nitrate/TMAO reductase-like tetraheme cytochrome c subunit
MTTLSIAGRRPLTRLVCTALSVLGLLLASGAGSGAAEPATRAAAKDKNTCVECHSDARFLVQNKKLYEYFQGWQTSIHAAQGVTCVDCHGGNPHAASKAEAHAGAALKSSDRSSSTNYRNIPDTCARCHKEIVSRFRLSQHYAHLKPNKDNEQGPNCVTCHGSVNTTVLNVNTVRRTCEQCHNEKTGNSPEIPDQAEAVLNNFLSISRYYRFIAVRSSPEDAKAFFTLVDPVVKRLNADWHTFEIDRIEKETKDLVEFLKVRRNDLIKTPPSKRK